MTGQDPETTPVIIGVGQINDRPETPADGLDPVGLMTRALRRADADAGSGVLVDCDSLSVVAQLAWPQLNPVDAKVAKDLGIDPAHRMQTALPNGDSPILLLHEAANRIGRGEAKICAIAGGEARLRAALDLVYAYYRPNARMLFNVMRDAEASPALRETLHGFAGWLGQLKEIVKNGLCVQRNAEPGLCDAALGLALSFAAWRALTQEQGLSDDAARDLMCGMVHATIAHR